MLLQGLSEEEFYMKQLEGFQLSGKENHVCLLQKKLSALDDAEAETGMEDIPYANAIGSKMYAIIGTRCDLGYALGLVSRLISKPEMIHWTERVWRYLTGIQDQIMLKNEAFMVEIFCDSNLLLLFLDKRLLISEYFLHGWW